MMVIVSKQSTFKEDNQDLIVQTQNYMNQNDYDNQDDNLDGQGN